MCLAILHFVVELGMGKKEADLLWEGGDVIMPATHATLVGR